ncbi:MAG: branched-chain amino acid ABC transporter permease [Pseudomonadota bacterium]
MSQSVETGTPQAPYAIRSVFNGDSLGRDSAIFWTGVGLLALAGWLIGDSYVLHIFILVFIWCVVISSWDLILGYAGIFNYAQLVFFAFGAYAAAMLSIYAGTTALLSIAIAGLGGAVVGALIALPALRLKGEYIALYTFAVHLALPPIIQQGRAIGMGGNTGLLGIPAVDFFGYRISTIDKLAWFWLALAVAAVSVYAIYFLILRRRMGLAFIAMRDVDAFAQAIGVNAARYKVLAFVVSAMFTAVAGGLYAHYTAVVTPKILGTEFFLMAMVMLAIGGMGRFPGAIIGVFVVVIGNELLRTFDDYRLLLLGFAVVLVVIFLPNGLVGLFRRVGGSRSG